MVIFVNVTIFRVQERMISSVRVRNDERLIKSICFFFFCDLGPDHGICGCDKRCKCRENWSGDDCSCTTRNDTCLVNNVSRSIDKRPITHSNVQSFRQFVITKAIVNVVDVNVIKIRGISVQHVKIVR